MRKTAVFDNLDALQSLELKISLSSLAGGVHTSPAVAVHAVFDDGDPPPSPEPPPPPGNPLPPPPPGPGPVGPA